MAIVKNGFSPGLHGRKTPASWGRRAHYLGREPQQTPQRSEQKAQLLSRDGEITRAQAIEQFGGALAQYHEAIVSWSPIECQALTERFGSEEAAKEAMAHAIAEHLAGEDRRYVVAIHDKTLSNGGRAWHLHVAVQGLAPGNFLGPRGSAQAAVDRAWRDSAPQVRIQDWAKHREFLQLRERLRELHAEQNLLYNERRSALRAPRAIDRLNVDRDCAERIKSIVERRYQLELAAANARYEARGLAGSAEHRVEIERAGVRRAQALSLIDRRSENFRARAGMLTRNDRLCRSARALDRALGHGLSTRMRAGARNVATALVSGAVHAALPQEARSTVEAATVSVRLAATIATAAVMSLATKPVALPLQAVNPVTGIGKIGLNAFETIARLGGFSASLPTPVRLPLSLLEKIPIAGLAAAATRTLLQCIAAGAKEVER